jgi:cyclopropane fatty-acyl-phospholipid synthase-like methyltransferase
MSNPRLFKSDHFINKDPSWVVIQMSIFLDAPWVPTSMKLIRAMLKLAELQPNETLYDLGSGDGRILVMAATEFKAKAIGIELNPLLVAYSNLRLLFRGLQNKVKIKWGNIFLRDISEADVVTMYLLQSTNNQLLEKLRTELKPGARIVSYVFTFPDWAPTKTNATLKLNLYTV